MPENQSQPTANDHPFLDALAAFIKSPAGQAIVQTLVAALIGSLTPKQAASVVALAAKHVP